LHERITRLCEEKGVSGSRMCVDIGISKSTLSDLRYGRTKGISMPAAQKMAAYLNVSVDYLLNGEEQKEKTTQEDGLTEEQKRLIAFAKSVPDDKVDLVLKVMRSIVEAE
jgi:transcriptional regulator with XRE-family HTH domain